VSATYTDFLARKAQLDDGSGFDPYTMHDAMFDFQRDLTTWAIRQGRGAIFADCGMGKTLMELTWAANVHRHTGKPVMLFTPLAVGFQIEAEAQRWGYDAAMSRNGTAAAPITITNYEQIEKFDPAAFGGVICDESSAIKSFDGVRRLQVTEFMKKHRYRLLGTATAAPNDYTELGTSSEALGYLGHMDMLNRFFVNDNQTSDTKARLNKRGRWLAGSAGSGWRFKGHAVDHFWRWVSSWARAIRKPSDYGYDDNGFILPELIERTTIVEARRPREGTLFDVEAFGLSEEREELRRTMDERCESAAGLLSDAETGVAWCHLNEESRRLARMIPGAVEVAGSDDPDAKEEKLAAFGRGEIRVLVTKPSIGAWGLNWQHTHRMTFFPSHSYEQYYQAVRRSWRFGQTKPVTVDLITTKGGVRALENLHAKSERADAMFDALVGHMNDALHIDRTTKDTQPMEAPQWLSKTS
jgi:hypothetical protein